MQLARFTCPAGPLVQLYPRSLVVGGGWDDKIFGILWFTMYIHAASYDPPEQPLLNREVRGRLRAGRRLATPAQIGSQSTVASQYLVFVQYCRGAAGITGYKLGRRCTAMVWLTLTNAVTRLDLGHIYKIGSGFSSVDRLSQCM